MTRTHGAYSSSHVPRAMRIIRYGESCASADLPSLPVVPFTRSILSLTSSSSNWKSSLQWQRKIRTDRGCARDGSNTHIPSVTNWQVRTCSFLLVAFIRTHLYPSPATFLWPLSSLLLVRMPFFLAFMLFGHPHFLNWSQVSSLIHWSTSMLVFPSHAVCCLIYLLVGGLKFAFDQDILKPYYRRGGVMRQFNRWQRPFSCNSIFVSPTLSN